MKLGQIFAEAYNLRNINESCGEDHQLDERELTDDESSKREAIVKSMKKDKKKLQAQYGDDWESVMYAIATKQAKGE